MNKSEWVKNYENQVVESPLQNAPFFNERLQHGMDIAKKKDQILQLGSLQYVVKSQKTYDEYQVLLTRIGWECSCPDYKFRGVVCKHIYAICFRQNHHRKRSEIPPENALEEVCENLFSETNPS